AVSHFPNAILPSGYLDDAAHRVKAGQPAKASADYLHTLARGRSAQGHPQEALELLDRARKLQPNSFDLFFDSAQLAAQLNQWDQMIDFVHREGYVGRLCTYVIQNSITE